MNPIYRGQYPPKNTDVLWIKGKKIFLFGTKGWEEVTENTIVDDSMVEDSTHAVQSKVIQQSLNGLSERIGEVEEEIHNIEYEENLSETSVKPIQNSAVYRQYMTEIETIEEIDALLGDCSNKPFSIMVFGDCTLTWQNAVDKSLSYRVNEGIWALFPNEGVSLHYGDVIEFVCTRYLSRTGINNYNTAIQISNDVKFIAFGNFGSIFSDNKRGQLKYIFRNTNIVSARNLFLPIDISNDHVFDELFHNCVLLRHAPSLNYVVTYDSSTPAIGDYTFYYMFAGCTSLREAPDLPENLTFREKTFASMFSGCSSLVVPPKRIVLEGRSNPNCGLVSMFSSCTSLEYSPYIKITGYIGSDYYSGAFTNMFYGCSALKEITCANAGTQNSGAYGNWVKNVSTNGVFKKAAGSTWQSGDNGIPTNWEVQTI